MRLALLHAAHAIQKENIAEAFATCLHCGKCQRSCPQKLPLQGFFFAVAASLSGFMRPDMTVRLLERALIRNPQAMIFFQPPLAMLGKVAIGGKKLPLPGGALLPDVPFTLMEKEEVEKVPARTVLLFPGCLQRHLWVDAGHDFVALMAQAGWRVITPPALGCCGRPELMRGASILSGVSRNLEILANCEFDYITSLCPGCLETIRNLWPDTPGLGPGKTGAALENVAKCLDLAELLSHVYMYSGSGKKKEETIFWHTPCLTNQEERAKALKLLGRWRQHIHCGSENACCGAPLACVPDKRGSGKTKNYMPYARNIVLEAIRQGADRIVTSCPGCMTALSQVRNSGCKPLRVTHLVTALAEEIAERRPGF